ncbi:MAG: SUMF1/EgtB/PvdO family nonheme iron enzyme, partial [Caldilinea sp.]
ALHTPAYLFGLMGDREIDLRVRVAAGEVLAEVGDPRFVRRTYAGRVEAIEPQMVSIPAGTATLGGEDPEADSDEQPECQVPVAAFELAVYPVTNAEFACFVEAGGYDDETLWTAGGQAWLRGEGKLDAESERSYRRIHQMLRADVEGVIRQLKASVSLSEQGADVYRQLARYSEDDYVRFWERNSQGGQQRAPRWWDDSRYNRRNQPVVGVSWYEAMAYAAWLSRVTGRPYRLPTEAEWEWAARRSVRRYPWGNGWDEHACNWQGSKLNRPNPVGCYIFSATDDGLQEMAGNVYTWTATLYRPCRYQADDGREDPNADGLRVMRGGSWAIDKTRVRVVMASDIKHIEQITANNVALRDQFIVVGGETIHLPKPPELLAYLATVRDAYKRWADQPENGEPLYDAAPTPGGSSDEYLAVDAKPLPMRVAEFRSQAAGQEPPAKELLEAVGDAHRTLILGEPGSGKTTALERLAWVTANASLTRAANGGDARLTLPLYARLADYQGEADLLPVLRRMLARNGIPLTTDMGVRAVLQATDAHFVLLLDGLNELSQRHAAEGLHAIRRHMDEFSKHTVHVTCRTADFDQPKAAAALPGEVQAWEVQPLADSIRHWGDEQGESDVRAYLHRHLGEDRGKRLYERLQADDRLRSLARLPLFLFMFKETAGDGQGELPANRGELVRKFVRSDRLLHPVPQELHVRLERSLEALAWRMAQAGTLEIDEEALLDELAAVRGRRDYSLGEMRRHLQATGLLVALGGERYRLLHQLVQEYGAAAHLAEQADCGERLPVLAQREWWRESCVLALWLRKALHTPAYLFGLMGDREIDLRVRVAAGEVLAEVGDPRFVR